MLIRIHHRTRYRYDRPVFLEPHTLRLTPRQDASQRVIEYSLTISPEPAGITQTIEPDGADAHVIWFSDLHDDLLIETQSLVETRRVNPFDFIVTYEPAATLPAAYPDDIAPLLEPYCTTRAADDVSRWADEIAQESDRRTLSFLIRLTERIYEMMTIIERPDGDPFPPERTLAERTGACRDLAVLFVSVCQSKSLAARFVSGYSTHHPPNTTQHELHAWAEVYLPGGGWRAFDPTLGLTVADGHVALATGPDHILAVPISGTYRGSGVRSTLEYDISLSASATQHQQPK